MSEIPRIAIVGDSMTDIDVTVEHVKTVDGMPVYREIQAVKRKGGAAAVNAMCLALRADTVLLTMKPSEKRRVYLGENLLFRLDQDTSESPTIQDIANWHAQIEELDPDFILVCDHAKGAVTALVMMVLAEVKVPIYVDPCEKSDWSLFRDVECISANTAEWGTDLENEAKNVPMKIDRMGSSGVAWERAGKHDSLESVCSLSVDAVGAGDQFLAVLACLRAQGLPWAEAIRKANVAAGMQCERRGIIPVMMDEIEKRLRQEHILVQS